MGNSLKAYEIRPATGKDLDFIYKTWLHSFRYDSALGKSCKNSIFFNEYRLVIDRILSESETLIAHSVENQDHILAYLVYEPWVLHYAFCKDSFRRLGIIKALFIQAFGDLNSKIEATHHTEYVSKLFWKMPNITHNPFKLFIKGAT